MNEWIEKNKYYNCYENQEGYDYMRIRTKEKKSIYFITDRMADDIGVPLIGMHRAAVRQIHLYC
jgi:hypothetical protein